MGEKGNAYRVLVGIEKERDHLGVGGRIMLRWILEK
jgi:hypothetical protein